jgi:hypothetical protein
MREYVEKAFDRVVAAVLDPLHPLPFRPILAMSVFNLAFECGPPAAVLEMQVLKDRFRRSVPAIPGRIFFATAEPGSIEKQIHVRIGGLYLISESDRRDYERDIGGFRRYDEPITMTLIGKLVRHLTDYPQWLLRGDKARAAWLLNEQEDRRFRNMEFYGLFRPSMQKRRRSP